MNFDFKLNLNGNLSLPCNDLDFPELRYLILNEIQKIVVKNNTTRWNLIVKRAKVDYRNSENVDYSTIEKKFQRSLNFQLLNRSDYLSKLSFYLNTEYGLNDLIIQDVYNVLCKNEYERINTNLKSTFRWFVQNQFPGEEWKYYQYIRPGYVNMGFNEPVGIINQILPPNKNITFLGVKINNGIHPKLQEKLQIVNNKVNINNIDIKINDIWCFAPRYIGGKKSLSNHAFGLALDIDVSSNPFLTSKLGFVINNIIHFQNVKAQYTNQSYCNGGNIANCWDELNKVSNAVKAFLNKYLIYFDDSGVIKDSTPKGREMGYKLSEAIFIIQNLTRILGNFSRVNEMRINGVVTLPVSLFKECKRAGISSGIEWGRGGKDTMHFEISPRLLLNN